MELGSVSAEEVWRAVKWCCVVFCAAAQVTLWAAERSEVAEGHNSNLSIFCNCFLAVIVY